MQNIFTGKKSSISNLLFFSGGAILYPCIELMWRGRTHWSMSVAGGLCTAIIHYANMKLKRKPLAIKCCLGGMLITGVEFLTGCIVNLVLGLNVWDYSNTPLNILGQVCPLYTIFWILLSLPVIIASNIALGRRKSQISKQIIFIKRRA
ncbi:MAG: hypothetical protein J6L81_01195 [Clostridia bacterium]|nr:hypothetical protein [Clostridia bacterium]